MSVCKKVACRSFRDFRARHLSYGTPFRRENAEFLLGWATLSSFILKLFSFRFAHLFKFVSQQHILAYEAGQSAIAVDEAPSVVQHHEHQYQSCHNKCCGQRRGNDIRRIDARQTIHYPHLFSPAKEICELRMHFPTIENCVPNLEKTLVFGSILPFAK